VKFTLAGAFDQSVIERSLNKAGCEDDAGSRFINNIKSQNPIELTSSCRSPPKFSDMFFHLTPVASEGAVSNRRTFFVTLGVGRRHGRPPIFH